MSSSPIVNWALRAFQALFGIVILGLSVTLIRGHYWGDFPSGLGFSAFVGGFTFLTALVGLAATWVSVLEGIVGLVIDSITTLLNIAAGIFVAIKLKGVSCKSSYDVANNVKLGRNDWFNGGCRSKNTCWVFVEYFDNESKAEDVVLGHCRESQATMVFMFLAAALFVTTGLMLFLRKRKGY